MTQSSLLDILLTGFHFIDPTEQLGSELPKMYQPYLVILSLFVASMAGYTAITISLIIRGHTNPISRYLWLSAGAIFMGFGIWAMHFIGMLSLNVSIAVGYDVTVTLISVIPAILAAYISLYLSSSHTPTRATVIAGGALMGLGIAFMHYTGMKGMIMNGVMRYDAYIMGMSILVAVGLAIISMATLSHYKQNRIKAKLIASLIMGSAIFGMHYVSMVGVSFYPMEKGILVSANDAAYLATGISIVTIATMALSVIAALVEHMLAKARQYSAELENEVRDRTAQLDEEIQERANTQSKLKESEKHLKSILSSAPEGIISLTSDGIVIGINTAVEKTFGCSVVDVLCKGLEKLIVIDVDGVDTFDREGIEDYLLNLIGKKIEAEGIRKSGDTFPLEVAVSMMEQEDDYIIIANVHDITERKEAEKKLKDALSSLSEMQEELIESEKMASLGGVVAGMSHEINTPIGVSVTAASHLQESTKILAANFKEGTMTKSGLESYIKTAQQSNHIMLSNLERASELISNFKRTAVDISTDDVREIVIDEYIGGIIASLKPELKKSAVIMDIQCQENLVCDTNPGSLSQIVTNLVMNSLIHGFAEGNSGKINIKINSSEDKINFIYEDNGAGMSTEVCEKVFEPFFTTKRGSGGSGLGMHILFNLVTQSLKGSVKCESALGEGVKFTLCFPQHLVKD